MPPYKCTVQMAYLFPKKYFFERTDKRTDGPILLCPKIYLGAYKLHLTFYDRQESKERQRRNLKGSHKADCLQNVPACLLTTPKFFGVNSQVILRLTIIEMYCHNIAPAFKCKIWIHGHVIFVDNVKT